MKLKVGQKVKFAMSIVKRDIVDDTGIIYSINGYYIYIESDKFKIQVERYPNELELI